MQKNLTALYKLAAILIVIASVFYFSSGAVANSNSKLTLRFSENAEVESPPCFQFSGVFCFYGSINFGVGGNQRLFFLSIKKRDIGKNFRYNKVTTPYRKEISLCPLLILSYLLSI